MLVSYQGPLLPSANRHSNIFEWERADNELSSPFCIQYTESPYDTNRDQKFPVKGVIGLFKVYFKEGNVLF
ncbi:hypothetical protein HanPSC8_Chr15g0662361 [Helianthus annuus]|nr:hypothetical protein HanPSC8_Chr15g0662361 [Helianthus annuus]